MGQLEVYNINEIYLNGIVISLFINYIAEELESNTFESFKPYFYSSNFANKKWFSKKKLIVTPENGIYKTWANLNLTNFSVSKVTKSVDDFLTWQDSTKTQVKIDKNVLKMQQKYNF